MSANATILIASEVVADADLVKTLLQPEFDNVVVSTRREHAVEDVEKHRPAVLILAFNSLQVAERYYAGLYRQNSTVHELNHRTIVLCNKDDLQRAFRLCKKRYFDDYVLFWPMAYDTPRLPLAVYQALWQMANGSATGPTAANIAAQARPLLELEARLDQYTAKGIHGIDVATQVIRRVQAEIGTFVERVVIGPSEREARELLEVSKCMNADYNNFKTTEKFDERLAIIARALQSVNEWASTLKQELAPQLKAAAALQVMAKDIRPVVLIVDDEDLQLRALALLLLAEGMEVVSAACGTEALAALTKRRPDLIVIDTDLPDIGGIEVTRRLKAIKAFADTPIIIVSGQSEKSVVVKSLRAGASDFVVKPFDTNMLLAKVRSYLNVSVPT